MLENCGEFGDCGECEECIENKAEWDAMWETVGILKWHPEDGDTQIDIREVEKYDWLSQADMLQDFIGVLTTQYNKVINEDYIKADMARWEGIDKIGEELKVVK